MKRAFLLPKTAWSALAGAVVVLCAASAPAADARFWTLTPYTVHIHLAVDAKSVPQSRLADDIAQHLRERADAAIGPLWKLTVSPLAGGQRLEALRGLSDEDILATAEKLADEEELDKLIVVTARETLEGTELRGVEVDPLLQLVGRPQVTAPCELHRAGEVAFGLVCDIFSPVAIFDVEKGDMRFGDQWATLSFRGDGLPKRPGAPVWAEPGDSFEPILRRTDREGEVVENGIQAAKWTYLQFAEPATDTKLARAKIFSHTKRPFGVRRRGRTERYAVLMPAMDEPTRIHLHVREHPELPLSGYQAYVKDGEEAETVLLGTTDADGMITIPPGETPTPVVYIKSGSRVLAKTPAPVGAVDQISIPLPDERVRLEAEAKLGLFREELIDLIARRSILAARIRDQIANGNVEEARKLFTVLDGMPGQFQLKPRLDRLRAQAQSEDPMIQKSIDQQFDDAAIVLGAFLGPDEVKQLQQELREAG